MKHSSVKCEHLIGIYQYLMDFAPKHAKRRGECAGGDWNMVHLTWIYTAHFHREFGL